MKISSEQLKKVAESGGEVTDDKAMVDEAGAAGLLGHSRGGGGVILYAPTRT